MHSSPNQTIAVSPYNAKIFDFDTVSSRVYIGREINQLLSAIGNDCIIDNLEINFIRLENDILTASFFPGKIIIDSTLIEFTENIEISLNVNQFDLVNGFFVVSIGYRYLVDSYENQAKIRFLYIDKNNHSELFQENYDRILLTKIKINNDSSIDYAKPCFLNRKEVIVNNKAFVLYPPAMLYRNILKFNAMECGV